jgi:hypothetical protein
MAPDIGEHQRHLVVRELVDQALKLVTVSAHGWQSTIDAKFSPLVARVPRTVPQDHHHTLPTLNNAKQAETMSVGRRRSPYRARQSDTMRSVQQRPRPPEGWEFESLRACAVCTGIRKGTHVREMRTASDDDH